MKNHNRVTDYKSLVNHMRGISGTGTLLNRHSECSVTAASCIPLARHKFKTGSFSNDHGDGGDDVL